MTTSQRGASPSSHEPREVRLARRIFLAASLSLALLGMGLASLPAAATTADLPSRVACAVRSVGVTVSDMDTALGFYTGVLPFELVADVERTGDAVERADGVFGARKRVCTLRLGGETLELTQYLAPEGRPIPVDSRSNDRWFQHIAIIVSDMDRAYAHLRAHKVRHASTGPQTIPASNPDAGGVRAFYFKDPDGHVLEILSFPPDKGLARWHDSERLFLGIDHTAIVVDSTEESLRFYRDALGLTVAGESRNSGLEQERLNNVEGASLRITSLRAPGAPGETGPAIELLEYLSPTDGRAYPAGSRANDHWHWHVTLDISSMQDALGALDARRTTFVSRGVVELDGSALAAVRDPDGHAIRLVESGRSRP